MGAAAAARRARVPHRGQRGRRRQPDLHLARRRHLRRLPGGAVRSRRPPLSLSLPQLHQLRSAADDHHRRPLRPRAHDDGRRSPCAPPAGRSTTTRPTAASTPSRPPARRAARACSCSDAAGKPIATRRPARRLRRRPARRARSGRSRAWAAITWPATPATRRPSRSCAGGSTATRSRSPSWCADVGRGRELCEVAPGEERAAALAAPSDRAAAQAAPGAAWPTESRRGNPCLGVMLPYTPLHHLLLRAAGRRAARDDQRQPLR